MPPEGVTEHQSLSAADTPQSPVALTERETVCASKVAFTLAGLTVRETSETDGTGSDPHPQEKLRRVAAQSSSNPFILENPFMDYSSMKMMSLASMVEPMGLRPKSKISITLSPDTLCLRPCLT